MTAGPETVRPTDDALHRVAAVLGAGGSVVLPTDTVYGLAALAGRPDATARLFELKGRSERQPMAVLVADAQQALGLVEPPDAPVAAWMDALWPGPLTLVLRRSPAARGLELGGSVHTIGVRCPDHAWVRALAAIVGPIATTSANRSGEPTPTTAAAAAAALVSWPELVVDGGSVAGTASTVVDATGAEVGSAGGSEGSWRVLRAGPVDATTLARVAFGEASGR